MTNGRSSDRSGQEKNVPGHDASLFRVRKVAVEECPAIGAWFKRNEVVRRNGRKSASPGAGDAASRSLQHHMTDHNKSFKPKVHRKGVTGHDQTIWCANAHVPARGDNRTIAEVLDPSGVDRDQGMVDRLRCLGSAR